MEQQKTILETMVTDRAGNDGSVEELIRKGTFWEWVAGATERATEINRRAAQKQAQEK